MRALETSQLVWNVRRLEPEPREDSMQTETIRYQEVMGLPKLAWLATLDPASGELSVQHGSAVERRDEWLVEGVWDGDFEAGDFHRSENFFGSGIRIEDGRVWFVPSSALVDRLLYCRHQERILVSNSLALLLGATGARLDPAHDYREETKAILKGIKKYKREFVVSHPEIDSFFQIYHERLVVENGEISLIDHSSVPEFASFADYHDRLTGVLRRIKENYESSARTTPLNAFATVSSGYDSPAVATLVKDLGVDTCFTAWRSNSSWPRLLGRHIAIDDGKPIADALGLRALYLDSRPSSISADELYFLAASTEWPELIFHSMARHIEQNCAAAVVFTGYHGDKVWDVHSSGEYAGEDIVRGDVSGLALSESRLKSGFINVAVPFIFSRGMRSIVAISQSDEMKPWRLNNDYDRPIPRRIVESAGVARGLFGVHKKAVTRNHHYPIHPPHRRIFFEHLASEHRIPASIAYVQPRVDNFGFLAVGTFDKIRQRLGFGERETPRKFFRKDVDLLYLTVTWALSTLADQLASKLPTNAATAAGPNRKGVSSRSGSESGRT